MAAMTFSLATLGGCIYQQAPKKKQKRSCPYYRPKKTSPRR